MTVIPTHLSFNPCAGQVRAIIMGGRLRLIRRQRDKGNSLTKLQTFKINSDALQFLVQLFSSDKRGAEATCPLRVLHTLQAVPWDLQLFMVLSKAADLLQQLHEGGSLVMVLVPMICK